MSYDDQLRKAREDKKLSQDEAAEAIGVSRVTIAEWEAGRTAPTKKHWDAIYRVLGVQLTLAAVEMERSPYGPTEDKYALVDRYRAGAGMGPPINGDHEEVDGKHAYTKRWLLKHGLVASACVVVDGIGDSMSPTISDGDVCLVNTASRRVISGKVFAFRTEDGVQIKRLFRQPDGKVRMSSDNLDKRLYPDEFLTPDMEVTIIGEVKHSSGDVV